MKQKHYVTVLRSQKITYLIETDSKQDAKEKGLYEAENETDESHIYDISDAESEVIACITHSEFLQYLRKEKNN